MLRLPLLVEAQALSDWKTIRRSVLARDRSRCTECGDHVSGRHAHVHHVLPRALGGNDAPANLITLCSTCHSARHLSLHASLGRRFLEKSCVTLAKIFAPKDMKLTNSDRIGLAMRYLGVERLRDGQLKPIIAALSGKSVLFISATGSGKSLCFQIPSILSPGHSLVISPLKSLMSDQVKGLIRKRVPATFINSDLSFHERAIRLSLLRDGQLKLIYLAPERLVYSDHRAKELSVINKETPSFLIVDEAHCIDKWGDSFRPSYQDLKKFREKLKNPPVLAFTATAGRRTREVILKEMGLPEAEIFVEGVDRPNIALLRLRLTTDEARVNIIKEYYLRMRDRVDGRALIFVTTIKQGHTVQRILKAYGLEVNFFNGKLGKVKRDFLQAQFEGRVDSPPDVNPKLMICTNAFGMGIDIPDVRLVFHWQHPASSEDYLQEFGRAGRDRKQSLAVVFYQDDDEKLLKWMAKRTVQNSDFNEFDRKQVLLRKEESIDLIKNMIHDRDSCFVNALLQELDFRPKDYSSIVKFLLSVAFSRREVTLKRQFCCDACWRQRKQGINLKQTDFGRDVIESMGQDEFN